MAGSRRHHHQLHPHSHITSPTCLFPKVPRPLSKNLLTLTPTAILRYSTLLVAVVVFWKPACASLILYLLQHRLQASIGLFVHFWIKASAEWLCSVYFLSTPPTPSCAYTPWREANTKNTFSPIGYHVPSTTVEQQTSREATRSKQSSTLPEDQHGNSLHGNLDSRLRRYFKRFSDIAYATDITALSITPELNDSMTFSHLARTIKCKIGTK